MKKPISHYINKLLFLHDCVIVPGFGGFISSKKSAELNKVTNTLIPPSKQILFNSNLKTNDGLLISYISKYEGISHEKSKQNVYVFSNELKAKLSKTKVLRLKEIGLFTLGNEGNITFIQDNAINYSLDAFGMKQTYNKCIVRKTDKQIDTTIKKITSLNSKVLLRAAVVLVPLIGLAYLSIWQEERINNAYSQMATFSPFSNTKAVEDEIKPSAQMQVNLNQNFGVINKKNDAIQIGKVSKEEGVSFFVQKKYYIIAGAYAKRNNASRMFNKLNTSNYNPEILKEEKFFRVSYDFFYNKNDALLALNKIKLENPEAWLLTK